MKKVQGHRPWPTRALESEPLPTAANVGLCPAGHYWLTSRPPFVDSGPASDDVEVRFHLALRGRPQACRSSCVEDDAFEIGDTVILLRRRSETQTLWNAPSGMRSSSSSSVQSADAPRARDPVLANADDYATVST
ncbi:hypothetical protein HPB50_019419 [Hyalomma asiaticum]|uniref:Uncharacterized protein n=1 Tax=Hyalomma asiaticum TaxID=266040 RepID=A0ACB7T6Z0_HYAAI|nr:hypothetical protein HPB50_019419 [Hyalomma asiaticum]